jgi:hypothetical protein
MNSQNASKKESSSNPILRQKTRITIYTFFFILLVTNLFFFILIRNEFPDEYHYTFTQLSQLLQSAGVTMGSNEVEAYGVVASFVLVIIYVTILSYGILKDVFSLFQKTRVSE